VAILKSTSFEAHEIPAAGGTYALLLACRRPAKTRVGSLGDQRLPRGWYIYVGSAFGPGGLRARCRRHLRPLHRLRWHIDYLRPAASCQGLWLTTDAIPREHQWAGLVGSLPGAGVVIRRFGSSDCLCPSHLYYFSSKPAFSTFRRLALSGVAAHGTIAAFSVRTYRQGRRNAL
jgi:Uri superfamily endonuclease